MATTDREGKRIYLYPEKISGIWNNRRSLVYYLLIVIYLCLPWLKLNGHQLILLDIVNREFFIFGGHFYAHNIPLLFVVLATFIFVIAFVTAVWGRVWCGWACPQSVFIEGVFRKIEEWVEGHARQRIHLDRGAWSGEKLLKKSFKWLLFLFVSLVISHSFLAYFVPVEELLKIIRISPRENMTLFWVMLAATGVVLFDFGWFREQFCIIACPYGRFQSVLMDEDSLLVAYDGGRGEPRKKPGVEEHGDCINCYKCVHVCPTGIDIRRGTQLECIQCTRCIDACDAIMDHIKKPRGLIRYSTERRLKTGASKIFRPRTFVYGAILFLCFSVGGYAVYESKSMDVLFLRSTKSPYQTLLKDGREIIVNHYKAEFFYRDDKELNLKFKTNDPRVEVVSPMKNISLKASRKKMIHIFFRFDRGVLVDGVKKIEVVILNGEEELVSKEMTLVGPY